MTIEIRHQPGESQGRYQLFVDEAEVGELDYQIDEGVRVYVHAGVRTEYEGQGLAATLVKHALDDARATGTKIGATCPYVRDYLTRHPEEQDLLA